MTERFPAAETTDDAGFGMRLKEMVSSSVSLLLCEEGVFGRTTKVWIVSDRESLSVGH